MSRRGITLVVAGAMILALGLVGARLPVPYVILTPGPTTNTLGSININGRMTPLIQVDGHPAYDNDKGNLNFTTVSYTGGPGNQPNLLSALRGWLSGSDAVVPQVTLFPPNTSVKAVNQQNTQEMQSSQQDAITAALTEAKIPLQKHAVVHDVQKGRPADGKLQPNDEITAVDGTQTAGDDAVTNALHRTKVGQTVTLTVLRAGKSLQVPITTAPSPKDKTIPIVGVALTETYTFPFKVTVSVGDVGGPSAGLMFSLGIYDKITGAALTGGRFVAGTGTITPQGQVGPIGGIQQKMIAARDAGATLFFVPPGNCKDALGHHPSGLRLVRADTMDSAVKSLEALKANPNASLPACRS
jgi:PDZ domain-containing protein